LSSVFAITESDLGKLKLIDMPWGSKASQVSAPAGFKTRHTDRPDSYAWLGKVGVDEVVIVYAFTPITEKLCEVTLIIGDTQKFNKARIRYEKYRSILEKSYGRPTHSYEYFGYPFLGKKDGEAEALSSGNYNLSNFWSKFKKAFIGMALTPEGWTCITFESNQYREAVKEEWQVQR